MASPSTDQGFSACTTWNVQRQPIKFGGLGLNPWALLVSIPSLTLPNMGI